MVPQPSAASPGILIADDDKHVRDLLGLTVLRAGFHPLVAAGGREAVELFRRHKDQVRAVLLDVNMPGLDGPGALARIRRIAPQVPCCFMTGYSDRYAEEALRALGATCVFGKPFRFDEALATLTALCGQTR
jgi:DNA-binding response OmpR family regulator